MRVMLPLLLLCLAMATYANDSRVIGQSGRVRMIHGEHTTVRMVRETVRMDVYPQTYTVTADFTFTNDGPPVTVTMGFPESGYGDISTETLRTHSGFQSFHTWVDGKEVPAKRQ